jgi:hypothetical protein
MVNLFCPYDVGATIVDGPMPPVDRQHLPGNSKATHAPRWVAMYQKGFCRSWEGAPR